MGVVADLVANNTRYATAFTNGGLAAAPALRLAVVTCMDARLDPARALGLEEGDAHVIRNAGGIVSEDVIRSLVLSHHLLGTNTVALIHHTRCAMEGMDEAAVAERIEREAGARPEFRLGAFEGLAEDLRAGAAVLGSHPLLATLSRCAFVYDVDSGRLHAVELEG